MPVGRSFPKGDDAPARRYIGFRRISLTRREMDMTAQHLQVFLKVAIATGTVSIVAAIISMASRC